MNRVVVTGAGAVSAAGIGAQALWHAVRDGVSGVRSVEFPRIPRQHIKRAARLNDADSQSVLAACDTRFHDRVTALGLAAAREAVAQSGLTGNEFGPRCAVIVGSGFGGADTLDRNYFRIADDPRSRVDPMSVPKVMSSSVASGIAREFGATGPCMCIATACSSASQSIGLAASLIRAGAVDVCIAGGAEALLVDGVFGAWEALHVMSKDLCRPFSKGRNGMVLGEGAGIVVLESSDLAKRRDARVIAELVGYGSNCDAGDLLRPDSDSAALCMKMAVEDSGLQPEEIGYVNAHGTGTVANDLNEAVALGKLTGGRPEFFKISSSKPVHGHALGASGALEFIVTLNALREQLAPPTINFTEIDPKIGFAPVVGKAEPFSARAALSNTFAFGGINAVIIVALPDSV